MDRLIFIGPYEAWNPPTNGESAKNQILLKRFQSLFEKVIAIDTQNWKKNPLCVLKIGFAILCFRNAAVVISACDEAAYKLIKFLDITRLHKNVCYIVIGGGLYTCIKDKGFNPKHYHFLKSVIVEGRSMKEDLHMLGINNVIVVPNLKPNYDLSINNHIGSKPIKFVFLSRIEPTKGCSLIIQCAEHLIDLGRRNEFVIDFYGRIAPEYENEFLNSISGISNIHYNGLLDLRSIEGYQSLQQYDVFLFPTFYNNEGFPGAIIDAFISGLPIVASDWHLNTEIIEDGKTGFIIKPNDEDAMFKIMCWIMDNPESLKQLSANSRKESYKYDINCVMSQSLINEMVLGQ